MARLLHVGHPAVHECNLDIWIGTDYFVAQVDGLPGAKLKTAADTSYPLPDKSLFDTAIISTKAS